MKKKYGYSYTIKEAEGGILVYEAAVHDLSAETADYLVKLLAKRFHLSRQVAKRRLIYAARQYCRFPRPRTLRGVWETRVDGAARSYKEQADELRP